MLGFVLLRSYIFKFLCLYITLERNGNLDPSGGDLVNQIDKLEYSYYPQTKNQLLKVKDIIGSPQGFDQTNDIARGDVDANNIDHTKD